MRQFNSVTSSDTVSGRQLGIERTEFKRAADRQLIETRRRTTGTEHLTHFKLGTGWKTELYAFAVRIDRRPYESPFSFGECVEMSRWFDSLLYLVVYFMS